MEAKVVTPNKPTTEDFFWLVNEDIKLGYKPNNPKQLGEDPRDLQIRLNDWVLKRHDSEIDKQGEFGLYYQKPKGSPNRYKAKVWPSFVLNFLAYKKKDHGFALVENEHGQAVFWAPPVRRTKNFARNLFGWSRIALELVEDRRICPDPECGELMHIYGSLQNGYRWKCINEELHGSRLPEEAITIGLSKESCEFFEQMIRRWKHDSVDPRRKSRRRGSFGKRRTDKWKG